MRIIVSDNLPARILYHGGPVVVEKPEVRESKFKILSHANVLHCEPIS